MAAVIDFSVLDTLQSYWREYYATIMKKYYSMQTLGMVDGVDLITNVSDQYQVTEQIWSEVIQPGQLGWTPKVDISFNAELIQMRPVKVDVPINPQTWQNKLEGYFRKNSRDDFDGTLEQFIWTGLTQQIARDHDRVDVLGVYVAPTLGTAGTALQSYNGLSKIYDVAVAAGKITPHTFSGGAITATNVVEALEELIKSVDADYRNQDLVVFIDPDMVKNYFTERRASFGRNVDYVAGKEVIDFTMARLQPLRWLTGTGKVICTVPNNLTMFEYIANEETLLKVNTGTPRLANLYGDWKRAVGFKIIQGLVWGY